MPTDDKVATNPRYNTYDNHNTRDQRRVGIWFVVVTVIFLAFLMALGIGHAPNAAVPGTGENNEQKVESLQGQVSPNGEGSQAGGFSVRQPVGYVELPGTVGQPQHFLSGHGNTPVPAQGVSAGTEPGSAINSQSFGKAQSGSAPSDAMQPGKNGMEQGNNKPAEGQNNVGGAADKTGESGGSSSGSNNSNGSSSAAAGTSGTSK